MRFFVGRIWLAAVMALMGVCLLQFVVQATTWTEDERITFSGTDYTPAVAAGPDSSVWVAWWSNVNSQWCIQCKHWDGLMWSSTTQLTDGWHYVVSPAIAIDINGNVHIVWSGQIDDNHQRGIYYTRWNGFEWTPVYRLSDDIGQGLAPCIAADVSGNIHVVWFDGQQYQLNYMRWDGAAWTMVMSLTDGYLGGLVGYSVSGDSSGGAGVVWAVNYPGNTGNIRWRYWNGVSWSTEQVAVASACICRYPSITGDHAGNMHMIWADCPDQYWGLYYKRWNGSTWTDAESIGTSVNADGPASIASGADNNVHVVWRGYQNQHQLHYLRWDGVSWGDGRQLTGNELESTCPVLATGVEGNVHLVWQGSLDSGSDTAIYHKYRKHCLDGDAFADCRAIGDYPSGLLFDARYTANADTFPQPPGEPVYYDSTKVTVTRTANDRLFLSGDPNMLQPWIADDKVYVNGISAGLGFAGVVDPAYPLCQPIESVLQTAAPRDVTDLIPMGECCVMFKLADTQRTILGNTRIYLVRQDAAGVADPFLSNDVAMLSVMPNPTQAGTALRLVAPQNGAYRASIQMSDGRLVHGWPVTRLTAGEWHEWQWDGRNKRGQSVGPGVYFGTVQTPGGRSTKKILIVK